MVVALTGEIVDVDHVRALYAALPRRVLLPHAEAIPSHRHAIREDGTQLPRAHPSRVCVDMAGEEN